MGKNPGFIAPPWPHLRGDSVSAVSIIERIEKEAGRTYGQHYEIYHYHAMRELQQIQANLSADDADTFMKVAASRGFHLNAEALAASSMAFHKLMHDIWSKRK
ncbi:hypothetical protein EC392_15900 [Lonsdalea populi]|uniref:Uncharacterized protein n=1 Tax=Lonsdalea populi TaxID=1172565 RepID=A0A3N0U7Z6_9GAMM|nr:hypothetical protein [Lonsdalea populi]ROH76244.1 hypothetical protein EC392_15900 [Lonsdalea populi]